MACGMRVDRRLVPARYNACNQARGYAPATGSLSGTPDAYEDYKRHDGHEDEDLLGIRIGNRFFNLHL